MADIEQVTNITEKAIDKANGVFSWFNKPKDEARNHLVKLIEESESLPPDEMISLIYNSRKLAREYANSKTIFEQAKQHFKDNINNSAIDDDWLHFFFDKAQKVSSKGLQNIWSQLLAGEFNKPGSISRKLLHIISIMDANSAISFQTFSRYVFERKNMFRVSYNTDAVLIPSGFYIDSFEFMLQVENWLQNAGYIDYKDLALNLTMNTGELNSLENLGLIQKVNDCKCEIPLLYKLNDNKMACLTPQDNSCFPLGQYAFTQEGEQLYQIIGGAGEKAVLEIVTQYLKSLGIKFTIDFYL